MKLGILSDIHEANHLLQLALTALAGAGVDQVVVLGDLFETGRALRDTAALLAGAGAVGVFGNHDLGLALDPSPHFRQRFGDATIDYFTSLRGRYVVGDCLFSHCQTWMDPADLEQPWYLHEAPRTAELLARNFAATAQRVQFQGHYHRWLAATPEGLLPWQGEQPLILQEGQRYLVVVHAVCAGWCATYDTETRELCPMRVAVPLPGEGRARGETL